VRLILPGVVAAAYRYVSCYKPFALISFSGHCFN